MRFSTMVTAAALLGTGPATATANPGPAADTSHVTLRSKAASTGAFVAWPAGNGPAAGLVLVHETWGLNAEIRDMARRFARQGYVTIVPDLYHGQLPQDATEAERLAASLQSERAFADLGAAFGWLRGEKRTAKSRLGVVGFNAGGALARSFAARRQEVAAVVVFYGAPAGGTDQLRALSAPLQFHFGEKDEGIDAAQVSALDAELSQAGKVHEVFLYPGAAHGFMTEGSANYHADAARQAWARTLAFLQKNLKARP